VRENCTPSLSRTEASARAVERASSDPTPKKPGNAGAGKGPQFKTDARRGEGPGDWATYQLRKVFRNCRRRYTRKRRRKPAIASTLRSRAWRRKYRKAHSSVHHRAIPRSAKSPRLGYDRLNWVHAAPTHGFGPDLRGDAVRWSSNHAQLDFGRDHLSSE
jgi:hypothetical protein